MSNTITITKEEYISLLKQEVRLNMLENGGVDNWEWYGESLNPEGEESYEDLCKQIEEENK